MQIKTEIVNLTPDIASRMLNTNDRNRPLKHTVVKQYAAAMLRGEWKLNGETIIISRDGNLLDGQHRISALASLADEDSVNVCIPFLVVRGVESDVFDTLDVGNKRTAGDTFHVRGESNCNALAAACRALHYLVRGQVPTGHVTTMQAEAILDQYPNVRSWVSKVVSSKTRVFISNGVLSAVLTLGASITSDDLADKFLDELATGVDLQPGSPTLALRERLIQTRNSRIKMRHDMQTAVVVKAWNAFASGKKIAFVRFAQGESMPIMIHHRVR